MEFLTLIGTCLLALASSVSGQTYTDETALRSNLSSGYNKHVRPATPTVVSIYYNVRTLQDLDITAQEMTLSGWLTLTWTDPRLTWDSSVNNIDEIEINWGWRPEFIISNSAKGYTTEGVSDDKTRIRVYSDGRVRWNPLMLTTTSCDVDISRFPFDTQTCELEVVFWSYRIEEVELDAPYAEVQKDVYLDNAEWTFDSSEVEGAYLPLCCPASYGSMVSAEFTFSRRRPFYVMNLIFPTILLSVCMVLAFMLPTESGERLGFALTILLAYTVQLSITAELMPTTSKQVPYIAQYLLIVLVLCSAITCNVVLHVKLFYLEAPVYGWMKAIYRKVHPVVFLNCCSRNKKSKDDNIVTDIHINRETTNGSFRKKSLAVESEIPEVRNSDDHVIDDITWANVSVCLDRICFYLYVIAVCAVNGVFLNSIS